MHTQHTFSIRHTISLLLIAIILLTSHKSDINSNVKASSSNEVYLPIIMKPPKNRWSGIHLGNRNGGLWEPGMLDAIDPRDGDGTWPAVVVALSQQIYVVNRSGSQCIINSVTANPNAVNSGVLDYLKAATDHGVKVIIRLFPSPGNFTDYDDPTWSNHYLSFGPPVGGSYCEPDLYRSPLDLALEMKEIQEYSTYTHGFEVFGFIPANEPNLEWYARVPGGSGWPTPNVTWQQAWEEMDDYFATVYDQVQNIKGALNIRVLTPTMSPNLFAEGIDFFSWPDTCAERLIGNQGYKGYDLMPVTYGSKNNGIAWHNYWIEGHELYNYCENDGGHASFYFPDFMKQAIHPYYKPPIIAEADIGSPKTASLPSGQIPEELTSFLDKDANPPDTSNSVRHFFNSEFCFGSVFHYNADPFIASWLLSDNVPPGNPEHDWHEAYRDGPIERPWFTQWWVNDGEFYYSCP